MFRKAPVRLTSLAGANLFPGNLPRDFYKQRAGFLRFGQAYTICILKNYIVMVSYTKGRKLWCS